MEEDLSPHTTVAAILGLGWHLNEILHSHDVETQLTLGATAFVVLVFIGHRMRKHQARYRAKTKARQHHARRLARKSRRGKRA